MAGASVYATNEIGDQLESKTFGPFNATAPSAGDYAFTAADCILPFELDRPIQIHKIIYSYLVAGGSAALAQLVRMVQTSTGEDTIAEAITAARPITLASGTGKMDLTAAPCVQRTATLVGADGSTAYSSSNAPPANNIIPAGGLIGLDFTGTLTALVGLKITIVYTTKINTRE